MERARILLAYPDSLSFAEAVRMVGVARRAATPASSSALDLSEADIQALFARG